MKRFFVFLLAITASAIAQSPLAPPDPSLLPGARKTSEIREGERNPFGQSVVVEQTSGSEQVESEEARLRRVLGALRITAVSGEGKGARALLGSLILREGAPFPQLFQDQQEQLIVERISKDKMVIAFVEKDATLPDPRRVTLPVTLKPTVRQMLFGEAMESLTGISQGGSGSLEKLPFDGVANVLQGAKDAELQNLTPREFELMGSMPDDQKYPPAD